MNNKLTVCVISFVTAGFVALGNQDGALEAKMNQEQAGEMIQVYNAITGNLEETQTITKSDEEWRSLLSEDSYYITREHGTESPFTGELLDNKENGVYICVACSNHLFDSKAKFESGTGWPSYYEPIHEQNVGTQVDKTLFMKRVEVHCARCKAHLGHVFPDGPKPTGQRFCINSAALKFIEKENSND